MSQTVDRFCRQCRALFTVSNSSTDCVDTGTSPHILTASISTNTVAATVIDASTSTDDTVPLVDVPIKTSLQEAAQSKESKKEKTKNKTASTFHSALAAAVQEIQTLREQLSQSGARYVEVKQQMQSMNASFDAEVARLKQEVAREKAEAKIGASYRKALASAALSHHLAMQKMKQQTTMNKNL